MHTYLIKSNKTKNLHTYLNESILSSTKSGIHNYLSKVMQCLGETSYHIEKLPGHKLESIIIDKSCNSTLNFRKCSKEVLTLFKSYDGFIYNTNSGMQYATGMLFESLENCDVDLSSFDFTDKEIIKSSLNISFTKCKNINIKSLPTCNKNINISLTLESAILTGFTNKDNTNIDVTVLQSSDCDFGDITDCAIFKNCKFNTLTIFDTYFALKDKDEYYKNNYSILVPIPRAKGKYIANVFNASIDELINSNIVKQTNKKELNINIFTFELCKLKYSASKTYKYLLERNHKVYPF